MLVVVTIPLPFLYSSVSLTTSDTPLSAVKIIFVESFFNSVIAFLSSFVMLGGGLYVFLMMVSLPLSILLPHLVLTYCIHVLLQPHTL